MVRFERKLTPKAQQAMASLEIEKAKGGTYNTEAVNCALKEMFYGKCYICENKGITSYQIEHLIPHKGNCDLKYDWNNLFLSCAHCNNIKNAKHDPILDCTLHDIDKMIAFRKKGYFGKEETLEFMPLTEDEETKNTVALLKEAYYGLTPQKKMEATVIRRELRKELYNFKECVREYKEAEGEEKEDLLCEIKISLSTKSPFTAFKRWLIRDNMEYYSELADLVS